MVHNIGLVGRQTAIATTDEGASQTTSVSASSVAPDVLTVSEVAALLRVDRKTVYAAIKSGQLPGARKIGAAIRVSKAAVLNWLTGQAGVSLTTKGRAR